MMPKIKLLSLIIISTSTIFIKNWQATTILFILAICLSYLLQKKREIAQRIRPLIFIGIMIILFQLLFNTSLPLTERLSAGLFHAGKVITLSLFVFIYTTTTSPTEMVSAFSFLPKQLQLIFTITLSLISIVMDEYHKIYLIQSSRGHNFKTLNIVKSLTPIIIPLLHRSLKRAEQIAIVMQSKGYSYG